MKIVLAGCVVSQNNKLLLLHRIKTNWYELPGGKLENDETPKQCAIREFKEELNCDIHIVRKLGTGTFQLNGALVPYHWFLAKINNHQFLQVNDSQNYDYFRYIPITTIRDYILSPNMENFVQELHKGNIVINE